MKEELFHIPRFTTMEVRDIIVRVIVQFRVSALT